MKEKKKKKIVSWSIAKTNDVNHTQNFVIGLVMMRAQQIFYENLKLMKEKDRSRSFGDGWGTTNGKKKICYIYNNFFSQNFKWKISTGSTLKRLRR